MLFRSLIYVENIENLTYIASTKKPGYPHFLKKKPRPYCFTRPEILRTHWHTHTKENNEKLVLICPPSLYPKPFSRRLPRGRMVADEKEQGFSGFGHLGKPFDRQLCVWVNYFVASTA